MTPHQPKRRWSDARRIDILEARERLYWSKFFGVDEQDLLVAVDQVGTSAEDVRQFLHRQRTRNWVVDGGRDERRRSAPTRRYFE
jgi:hypothetical protein